MSFNFRCDGFLLMSLNQEVQQTQARQADFCKHKDKSGSGTGKYFICLIAC